MGKNAFLLIGLTWAHLGPPVHTCAHLFTPGRPRRSYLMKLDTFLKSSKNAMVAKLRDFGSPGARASTLAGSSSGLGLLYLPKLDRSEVPGSILGNPFLQKQRSWKTPAKKKN